MEHVSKPLTRVMTRALLVRDQRLAVLFPPGHRVREPQRDGFHMDRAGASADLEIDHSALLDALWKLRCTQQLMTLRGNASGCTRTKEVLVEGGGLISDLVADIELLLARKAEAELWCENVHG